MSYDRRQIVTLLRRLGYTRAADEAVQVLPDPISAGQFWEFADGQGIARDEVVNRMGGSP